MGEPASEPWVAETQSLLGAVIKRPKLTEPLLKKPPFRFLHDIVSEVTKATGFADGLYDERESNSANIKEKDAKIAYLQKIIDCASFALSVKIDIRPNKVVAGMEPEATNAFLQCLARAATDAGVDRGAAVARVLGGETTAPKVAKPKEPAPPPPEPAAPPPEPAALPMPEPVAALAAAAPEPRAASALGSFQSEAPTIDEGGGAGGGGRAARPRSARRPAPKVSSNVVKIEPTAPRSEETAAMRAIIAEGAAGADDEDDDGVDFVGGRGAPSAGGALLAAEGGEGHTKIVKDILETQKQMEEAGRAEAKLGGEASEARAGGGGGGGIILGKKKPQGGGREGAARQHSTDEIQKLRQDIQALCQSTNPLGKSLEYVHEDFEAMTRELEHWRGLHRKHKAKLHAESQAEDGAAKALEASLEDVEQQIAEEQEKIRALKAAVIRNDAIIAQLLDGVVQ